jgi:hypothetical protein
MEDGGAWGGGVGAGVADDVEEGVRRREML